jgi:hypothetical protein
MLSGPRHSQRSSHPAGNTPYAGVEEAPVARVVFVTN